MKISSVACGFSPVKIDYSDYPKKFYQQDKCSLFFSIKYCYSIFFFTTFIIPPQNLFVVGILFSRCPCVRASVHASVRNILFF